MQKKYCLRLKSNKKIYVDWIHFEVISRRYFKSKFKNSNNLKERIDEYVNESFIYFVEIINKKQLYFESLSHFEKYFTLRLREVNRNTTSSITGVSRHHHYKGVKVYELDKENELGLRKDVEDKTEIDFDHKFKRMLYALHFIQFKYAIVLYYRLFGFTNVQIAKAYHVSDSEISQRIKKAQNMLKEILTNKKYLKKLDNFHLERTKVRFVVKDRKELEKALYKKYYMKRHYKKNCKNNKDYLHKQKQRRQKHRSKLKEKGIKYQSDNMIKRYKLSQFIKDPEKYRESIRIYRSKNKAKINERERKRSATKERKEYRKRYESREDIKERIRLRDRIKYLRSDYSKRMKKGIYVENPKIRERNIKELERLLILKGKDKRFARNRQSN